MKRAECNRNCWIAAAVAGVVVLLLTSVMGDLGFMAGLFLGLITAWLFGSLLVWLACHDRHELFADAEGQTGTDWAREAVESQPEALLVSGSLGLEHKPSVAGGLRIVAGAAPAAAKPEAAKAEAATRPAADDKARKPATQQDQPAAAAEQAAPDDLKRIKGIGPKLSDWLHENGITRYAQIAAWDDRDVADFAERLGRMGGRIEADDWVGQAKLLAEGRRTEFSERVDDGEVY
ncbi:Predicted 5' DNA nuclease, flap endonuclease-1-like, helix-3-turn-helix (H3TH) domain [Paracoccus halophilus]|uniref:Predicted 5' DNA nuclease, flap endonuclease-1-like, helix-3-turn-helix (H3TH) domain n=1 Tax=Paracoccus halophilus TaxID=376733 RepID=A0A099F2Y0_9RHOB|nr:hypothetical protein [Paracoccus halophilus]KGJ04633.1 hypothetical protein IT41_09760 [Paracoccus halophilus]SFA49950.1 Predicted 5' DNA nuclease, flap endonuclease-1-like, helix-3-turn-helix (H3TH) domain [Paracoccus halophilus]